MIAHAIAYAARGWRVFPLACGGKEPAIGRRQGGRGCLDATTDLGQICRWWEGRFAARNVGIATGRASGIVVVDVDARAGGYETMARLVAEHGAIPPTLRARTGAGVHLYFAAPSTPVRSAAHVLGAGVDTRGEGGYVVGPPSIHPSGARYRWITQHEPATLPVWMLALAERSAPVADPFKGSRVSVPVDVEKRARAWLDSLPPSVQGVNTVARGTGSDAMFWAAIGVVRGFALDPRTAFYMLKDVYNPRCQPPWSDRELEHKVNDASRSSKPLGFLLNAPRRVA